MAISLDKVVLYVSRVGYVTDIVRPDLADCPGVSIQPVSWCFDSRIVSDTQYFRTFGLYRPGDRIFRGFGNCY